MQPKLAKQNIENATKMRDTGAQVQNSLFTKNMIFPGFSLSPERGNHNGSR
jgi:hypothetical protein